MTASPRFAASLAFAALAAGARAQHIPAEETRPGKPAPPIDAATVGGGRFQLNEALKKGPVVFAFLRGTW